MADKLPILTNSAGQLVESMPVYITGGDTGGGSEPVTPPITVDQLNAALAPFLTVLNTIAANTDNTDVLAALNTIAANTAPTEPVE